MLLYYKEGNDFSNTLLFQYFPGEGSMSVSRLFTKRFVIFILLLLLVAVPLVVHAQTDVTAEAHGFGAAFAYAQRIGPVTFAATGTIGDGYAHAFAGVPGMDICSYASNWTWGPAAGSAAAFDSTLFELAQVEIVSVGGAGFGYAGTCP